MLILAGANIWLAVVIFNNLSGLTTRVAGWINTAFQQHGQVENGAFRGLEELVSIFSITNYLFSLQFLKINLVLKKNQ